MKFRILSGVATVALASVMLVGTTSCGKSDNSTVGKFMLPDADIVAVGVSDIDKKGAYTKECESALAELGGLEGIVKSMTAELDAEDRGKVDEVVKKFSEYIMLVTNGMKRAEFAASAKFTPGPGDEPDVKVSLAVSGFKSSQALLDKLAADLPDYLKLDGGALVPKEDIGVKVKAWVDGDVLRATVGEVAGKSDGSSLASDDTFGELIQKLSGDNYSGLRVKDPAGIVKRFAPAEEFAEIEKDERFADLLKIRSVGFDCVESKSEPTAEMTLTLKLDSADTASSVCEKLIALKQMAIVGLQTAESEGVVKADQVAGAKKVLNSVKIQANGSSVSAKASVDARDQVAQLKKLMDEVKGLGK